MIQVKLSFDNLWHALWNGFERFKLNHPEGKKARREMSGEKDPENTFKYHLQGAIGEKAVATALNLPWHDKLGCLPRWDVGHYQVRSTDRHTGNLLLSKRDYNHDVFIFVTGKALVHLIHGWAWGHEAKQEKYWRELQPGRPCYVYPKEQLHNMDDLPSADYILTLEGS